jgi:hypothetical protein
VNVIIRKRIFGFYRAKYLCFIVIKLSEMEMKRRDFDINIYTLGWAHLKLLGSCGSIVSCVQINIPIATARHMTVSTRGQEWLWQFMCRIRWGTMSYCL